MIEFRGLAKNYGNFHAVKPLTLSVARGEVFGFLGPNGAGKTTTIRMMMGILAPSRGQVCIDGFDCHSHNAEVKRRIGYLPDNPIFYNYLRGREILQFVGEMHGFSRSEAAARADQLLHEFELDDATDEYAVNYSLGMKKKLGLACALIHDPQLLILDEPIKGLDPSSARDIRERLLKSAAQGKTIFVSTHLLDMAEHFCSRVGIIHHGELIATGSLQEIKDSVSSGGSLEQAFLKITDEVDQSAPMPAYSLARAAA